MCLRTDALSALGAKRNASLYFPSFTLHLNETDVTEIHAVEGAVLYPVVMVASTGNILNKIACQKIHFIADISLCEKKLSGKLVKSYIDKIFTFLCVWWKDPTQDLAHLRYILYT